MKETLLPLVLAYLAGSLNFGGILGLAAGRDPKSWGSGRLGAWNTARRLGPAAGAAVFAGDFAKGLLAVWLARRLGAGEGVAMACGLMAAAGHVRPLFFGFRGGKGLATSLGVLAALDPRLLVLPPALAAGVFLLTRHIYSAALAGIAVFPFWMAMLHPRPPAIAFGIALCALLLLTHRGNIAEIIAARGVPREVPGGEERGKETR